MAQNVVGSVAPLPRHSDEYARLEHLLQVSCRSTAVKDVSAWVISNPALAVSYERRSAGMLSVDCWVDISSLDSRNPVQEVCKRGFYPPENGEGLPFVTGNIRFDMEGPETHQYLLCTVAVGRSYVQDDPSAPRSLQPGYDSLYLHIPEAQSSSSASDSSSVGGGSGDLSSAEAYRHTYVVFESAQVIPRYVCHFNYHPRERLMRQPVKPINLAEIKAKVADALSLLGPAAPVATEKMLSDIGDAYEAAITSSQSGDPLLEERKRGIRDVLKAVDNKLAAIQSNSAAVEEALYKKLQDALLQLQEETQRKMNLLLSEELELRRQLQQIEWGEAFVHTMQETLPPMSFVSAWERHSAFRSQLYAQLASGLSSAKVLEEVQPDMKLVGSLEVTTEKAAAASAFAREAAQAQAQAVASLGLGGAGVGAGGKRKAGGSDAFDASAAFALPSHASLPSTAALGASLAASGADPAVVNSLLTALLRESMGIKPAAPPAPPAPAAVEEAQPAPAPQARRRSVVEQAPAAAPAQALPPTLPPPGTLPITGPRVGMNSEQAKVALESAKAQLGAVERTLETLPPSLRATGEASRATALQRVAEAEAFYSQKVREEAQAYLTSRFPPSSLGNTSVMGTPSTAVSSSGATTGLSASLISVPQPPAQPRAVNTASAVASSSSSASASAAPPASSSPSKVLDVEDRRQRHSIRSEAERKKRVYGLTDADPALAFPSSRILSLQDAANLYLCLPFGVADDGTGNPGALPPIAKLIWATYDGSHTVQSFLNAYTQLGNNEPTVVLIKTTGGAIIGGYSADPWSFDDLYGGSPRSFLFSLTRDCKIPYTGRVKGPKQITDDLLRQEHHAAYENELTRYLTLEQEMAAANGGEAVYDEQGRLIVVEEDPMTGQLLERVLAKPKPRPFVRCDALKSNARSLQFGLRDLVLSDDFARCSTEIEQSYGIGLRPGSVEAKTFLCGVHEFVPEVIEIWAISGNAAGSVLTGESAGVAGGAGAGAAAGAFDPLLGPGYVDEMVNDDEE